jgi:hypothetical protein
MIGFTALVAGIIGYFAASAGVVWLIDPLAARVPVAKHVPFLADAFAHTTAYAIGFLGGAVVLSWAWRERGRRSKSVVPLL